MDRFLLPWRQGKFLNTLFISTIFISIHYALILYINSSFLEGFFSASQVSVIYIIGSIIETVLLLNASKILEKIGNRKFTISAICIEFLATLGMAFSTDASTAVIFFLIHMLTISMIAFNIDILLEDASDSSLIGEIRGTYLTLSGIAFVLAPALVSLILVNNKYFYVYIVSAIFMLPLYKLIQRVKTLKVGKIRHIEIRKSMTEYLKNKDLYNIFVSQFLLQLFYSYMVVYTPIYLSKYIGFSWTEIGLIFTIMLTAFVIFEVPVGELADTKYGEKEFITVGFIIMGLATLFISFITVKEFFVWATVLFITRIGASFVEVSTDSYFFKKVNRDQTDLIGFYRISRPVSFVVGPLLAILSLQFLPFEYIFLVIGTLMILGTKYSLALKDTK